MRKYIWGFSVLLLLSHVPALAVGFGIRKDGKLDKSVLSKAYRESDWDELCKTLESYLRVKDENRIDLEERIFAYKHLGVIYASDSLTQTRAESYFIRLLDLSPNIEIVDMYISKKISDFFREVKQDYKIQKTYSSKYDEFGREVKGTTGSKGASDDSLMGPNLPRPAPKQSETQIKRGGQSWIWWTVGLVAATGIGAGVYFLTQEQTPKRDTLVTFVTPQH
jgi:hypothetical protein